MFVNVVLPSGETHRLEAPEGYRVMEVIRDYGLPIKAECGGACACATCHVRVGREWLDRVVPPTDEEIDRLDDVWYADERSRLSCQILTSDALDGLVVELARDAMTDDAAKAPAAVPVREAAE